MVTNAAEPLSNSDQRAGHRNIVLLSDGTGNSAGKLHKTNVWRVYEALDLFDPQDPKQPRQFALYDDGVGTSTFRPLALLGGAFGVGLARNVRELYAFLCRMYRPGDKIYALGFSRGAFTIRVLVGLVMNQGLVRYDGNEARLARNTAAAYRAFRRNGGDRVLIAWLFRAVRDALIWLRNRLNGWLQYDRAHNIGGPYSRAPISVEFMGLWDTVDAYGLPIDELTIAIDKIIWPLKMREQDLNLRVRRACHALALDDERNTFHPRLWNEESQQGEPDVAAGPNANRTSTHIRQERISQVWFAGVHSNVGGGYADDGLAHVSLEWIMQEAKHCGLRFSDQIWNGLRALGDENGPLYDSRRGILGYYRYNPRRVQKLTNSKLVHIPRTKVHESVFRRIRAGHDGYAPFVVPPGFAVVRIDGTIVDGPDYLQFDESNRLRYGPDQERVFNLVWWRRGAYFFTLAVSILLLTMPLRGGGLEACQSSRLCFVADAMGIVTPLLPGFTAAWTRAFAHNPAQFLILAVSVSIGLGAGSFLSGQIRDKMRRIWYRIPDTTPAGLQVAPTRGGLREWLIERINDGVQWLRTRSLYQFLFRLLTQMILPTLALFGFLYAATAFVGKTMFAIESSGGGVCESRGSTSRVPDEAETAFSTSAVCASTGLKLERGATYRLRFLIPASTPWHDAGIAAGPRGVAASDHTLAMTFGIPLRRHMLQPYFKPIARIGANGNDEYVLDPKPSLAPRLNSAKAHDETFDAEIVARSTGELFLYVNDAVFPSATQRFYGNNEGSAKVQIKRLVSTPP